VVQAPITENATFYVGLTIVTTSGGSVSYTYGNSGSVQVTSQTNVYVSPGTVVTLTANPSSLLYKLNSWSGAVTSASTQTSVTVNAPSTAEAQFGPNFINIGVIVGVVVIALVGIAVAMMRRKPS
jgi:Divergent InlB B-repeat domain